MEEKVLVKSEQADIKQISIIIALIGVAVFAIVWDNAVGNSYFYSDVIERGDWGYALTSMVPYFGSMTFLPFAAIALLFYFWTSKVSLTVTDKRVYGTAAFGKRVDLPLDMISAVGTTLLNGIAVTTSSGAIKFLMIKNSADIHEAISKLLMERQDARKQAAAPIVTQELAQSGADELKKYKELLDDGVISQEEFDAKKKQLLGL